MNAETCPESVRKSIGETVHKAIMGDTRKGFT